MKRSLKKLIAFMLVFVAMLSMSLTVFAADEVYEDGLSEKDGLKIEVTTDKDTYSSGDTIEYTVKVTNTNSYDLTNITYSYTLPSNVDASFNFGDLSSQIGSLKAGESKTVTSSVVATSATEDPNAGGSLVMIIGIIAGVVVVLAVVALVVIKKKKKSTIASMLIFALVGSSVGMMVTEPVKIYAADDELSEYSDYKRVSVHDPSIVKDPETGMYYIFGSHKAFAKSADLKSWTTFSNNVSKSADELLGDVWTNYSYTPANSDIQGNLWAPDVIYNETMGKWCMYMSVNGNDHHSVIVLLTADDIEGPYEYVGGVMYSGFDGTSEAVQAADTSWMNVKKSVTVNSEEVKIAMRVTFQEDTGATEIISRAEYSDIYDVLGEGASLTRYNSTDVSKVNAIDPNVQYDENGDLWMTYGSWSAGIYQVKLNTETGLRDYDYTYEYVANTSDPYLGYKLAGGYYNSGEGAYILKTDDYYYLYISLGNLESSGGYNMRVFRSESINGPYLDQNGKSAIWTSWSAAIGYIKDGQDSGKWTNTKKYITNVGYKIMGAYMMYGIYKTYVAQGHNSAFVDDDGKMYLVYHTRFADNGEGHEVRVHQLGMTSDGWIVATPYEYAGESFGNTYTTDQIVGTYEFILHAQNMVYAEDATGDRGIAVPQNITLNADGTITGELTGTWATSDGENVTMTIDGTDYTGLFIEQQNELTTKDLTMTFTLIGNDQAAWGVKNPELN